jgi:hypothetical protein
VRHTAHIPSCCSKQPLTSEIGLKLTTMIQILCEVLVNHLERFTWYSAGINWRCLPLLCANNFQHTDNISSTSPPIHPSKRTKTQLIIQIQGQSKNVHGNQIFSFVWLFHSRQLGSSGLQSPTTRTMFPP